MAVVAKLAEYWPNLLFVKLLHDNVRPHTTSITQVKLLDPGWEVYPHRPYSPDLAPSDYHLF